MKYAYIGGIYAIICNCKITYIGMSVRHFKVRISEHMGISCRTGAPVKGISITAVRDLCTTCNKGVISEDDFKIISRGGTEFDLWLKESLMILLKKPALNKNVTSTQLFLFD